MKRKTLKVKITLAVTQAVLVSSIILGGLGILFSRDNMSTNAYEIFKTTCENEVKLLNGNIEKICENNQKFVISNSISRHI